MLRIEYLRKDTFAKIASDLFAILAGNMAAIAPTGNTYEDDFKVWLDAVGEGLQKEARQMVLALLDDDIVGYFQYHTNGSLFMMEEVQIKPKWQKKHQIFRGFYGLVCSGMPQEVSVVEAYANKQNAKSIAILRRLGLEIIGENKNGSSYHFRGKYADLLTWYNSGN